MASRRWLRTKKGTADSRRAPAAALHWLTIRRYVSGVVAIDETKPSPRGPPGRGFRLGLRQPGAVARKGGVREGGVCRSRLSGGGGGCCFEFRGDGDAVEDGER